MLQSGDKEKYFEKAKLLMEMHKNGELGGEQMPEDENPKYPKDSKENVLYFTLPMALNYQRNSYKLWESANMTAMDTNTVDIYSPEKVVNMSREEVQQKLVKYKVALQQNKQTDIWIKLCHTFNDHFNGDVRNLFLTNQYDIAQIKAYMLANKKLFPYLSGNKIMNYWLYVLTQYTNLHFVNRRNISVAPDTHVIQASLKLGIISEQEANSTNVQAIVAQRWEQIFEKTQYDVIDIHTPLWLWSRQGFRAILDERN